MSINKVMMQLLLVLEEENLEIPNLTVEKESDEKVITLDNQLSLHTMENGITNPVYEITFLGNVIYKSLSLTAALDEIVEWYKIN